MLNSIEFMNNDNINDDSINDDNNSDLIKNSNNIHPFFIGLILGLLIMIGNLINNNINIDNIKRKNIKKMFKLYLINQGNIMFKCIFSALMLAYV